MLCWCGFCLSTYKWKVFFTHQSHLWSSTGLCAETNAIHPQKVPLWTVVVDQCHDNLHMNDQQTDLTARCSSVKPWDHDQVWNTEPPPNPDIAPDETFDPQTRSASTFISTLHSVYKNNKNNNSNSNSAQPLCLSVSSFVSLCQINPSCVSDSLLTPLCI